MDALLMIISVGVMLWILILANTQKDNTGWPPDLRSRLVELVGGEPENLLISDDKLSALAILPVEEQIIFVCFSDGKIIDSQYFWKDLVSVELVKDGETVTTVSRGGQMIGALVGGAIAGGVGALMGGLSATTTAVQSANRVELILTVDDITNPRYRIALFDLESPEGEDSLLVRWNDGKALWSRTAVKQKAVLRATENGLKWLATLEVVMHRVKASAATEIPAMRRSDRIVTELEKLAGLRSAGMLTEEEFLAGKRNILDLNDA